MSRDTLLDGRLVCHQYRDGYRFSIDAVLLAHFAVPGRGARVLDLGAGCGVIALLLAHRYPSVTVTALEYQPDLLALAAENVRCNGLEGRVWARLGDARDIGKAIAPESFDLVVCNAPYHNPRAGRVSADRQRARARHTLTADLGAMVRAAAFAVKNRGRVAFVYPATALAALLDQMQDSRLEPKRIRPVYSYPGKSHACLVLVEARKNGGPGAAMLAPLYIYSQKQGRYSPELEEYYRGVSPPRQEKTCF